MAFQLPAQGDLTEYHVSPMSPLCVDDADEVIEAQTQVATDIPVGIEGITSALGMCGAAIQSSLHTTDFPQLLRIYCHRRLLTRYATATLPSRNPHTPFLSLTLPSTQGT